MLQNKGGGRGKGLIPCALAHSKVLRGLQGTLMRRHLAVVELALLLLL